MSTKESLAHLASRGGLVEQNNDLWWHGPKWLSEPSAWPADITTTTTTETLARGWLYFTSTAFGVLCVLPRG